MRRLSRICTLSVFTLCVALVTGCTQTNPPFTNKLNVDNLSADKTFDPFPTKVDTYKRIMVLDDEGHQKILDATKQPILFEAYWCPHCQRTLVLLDQKHQAVKEMPSVVSMGFADGTTLADAVRITHEEIQALHLKNIHVYYLLSPNSRDFVPHGFPSLVFPTKQGLQTLAGEHEFSAWRTALSH